VIQDPKFKRSPEGALISTDKDGLKAYKMKKNREAAINNLMDEQKEIRREMTEIKDLLRAIARSLA